MYGIKTTVTLSCLPPVRCGDVDFSVSGQCCHISDHQSAASGQARALAQ